MWAKCVNASVVEPFVINSMFRIPIVFSEKQLATQLRFRYYFDIYNNMRMSILNRTPLIMIPWETFADQTPKK